MKKPAATAAYQATISSWSIDRTVMGTAGTIRGPWTNRQPNLESSVASVARGRLDYR
jgi:hypothetical protein